jgi:hypothetical protein
VGMNKPSLPTLPTSPTLPTLPTFQISLKHRTQICIDDANVGEPNQCGFGGKFIVPDWRD